MVVVLVVDTEGSPVVVGAAVVVVVSGQGLYRPKGAKTGRLQSGWKRPNILSSSTTRGLERRGEIRQSRKTEVFMALTSHKVENSMERLAKQVYLYIHIWEIESFVISVMLSKEEII